MFKPSFTTQLKKNYSLIILIFFVSILPIIYLVYSPQIYQVSNKEILIYYLVLFPLGFFINLLNPGFAFFSIPFLSLISIRIGPIFFHTRNINILFPLFYGASLGLMLYLFKTRERINISRAGRSILYFIIIAFSLSFIKYSELSNFNFSGYAALYPGLGYNYAIFLALVLPLSIFYPIFYSLLIRSNFSKKEFSKKILLGLIVGLIVNLIIVFIQTFLNLNFISKGSGTAVGAKRAAGLLADSGASGTILPFFFLLVFIILNFFDLAKKRYLYYFFLILSFFISILLGRSQGRVYWLGFIPVSIYIFLVLFYNFIFVHKEKILSLIDAFIEKIKKIFLRIRDSFDNSKKSKNDRLIAFLENWLKKEYFFRGALVVFFLILIKIGIESIYFFSSKVSSLSFNRVQNFFELISFSKLLSAKSISTYLDQAFQRFAHGRYNLVMDGIAMFKKSILVGWGINSFIVEHFNPIHKIRSILENPGSLYISFLSDFGIIGSMLIFFWIYKNLIYKNKYAFITILAGIPFLVGSHMINHDVGAFFSLLLIPIFSKLKFTKKEYKFFYILFFSYTLIYFFKHII